MAARHLVAPALRLAVADGSAPRVVAPLRARLAQPVGQAGPESQAADPVPLVAKAELQPAPGQPVAAMPDEPLPAAERVREVVLHPAVKSVQEVLLPPVAEHAPEVALRPAGKPELRLALARPVAATLGEPPLVAERVPEGALPLVVERALEVLPPLAEAHVPAASRHQAVVRDARQQAVAVRVRAGAPRLEAAEPDEQPPAVAQRAARAWAAERRPAVLQAAPRPASQARRPGPVQHVPA
jgi:hypothetical protein